MGGSATLLVANAGWTDEQQYNAIVQAAADRDINLLWFSSIDSLTNYINNGGNGGRANDPITSLNVFAHGTDGDTGNYAITFGLYTNKDEQLKWYNTNISRINGSAFASGVVSKFYTCRTGNTFDNGNFAQLWANKTSGETYAYSGLNGRSQYSDILGTWAERHGMSILNKLWSKWSTARGDRATKPGEAWRLPRASYFTSMTFHCPAVYIPTPRPGPKPR